MTFEIGLVLAMTGAVVLLFWLERPRADVVALMLLGGLAVTGLVEPKEALSGFSNPAVITVWAVFILSGGLSRTGVANLMGRQILRVSGGSEVFLMILIMVVAGVLSAFMNNVGATALLLPVVMDLARRTRIAPSKLLIPLSFSSLLGGMMTLIGTPPNILIAEAVRNRGLEPLGLFDFTPLGGAVLLAGILYMVTIGRRLLPERDVTAEAATGDLRSLFGLHKRLLVLHVPADSGLVGRTLAESRIHAALDMTVIGIIREGRTRLAPATSEVIRADDRLLTEGRPTRLEELRGRPDLVLGEEHLTLEEVVSEEADLRTFRIRPGSSVIGRTLRQLDFRNRYGHVVVAIRREGALLHSEFDVLPLRERDVLLVQSRRAASTGLAGEADFEEVSEAQVRPEALDPYLMRLRLPEGSVLVGKTLGESRLAEAYGLMLLALERDGEEIAMPDPEEVFRSGDTLLVKGDPEDLRMMRALQSLRVERRAEHSMEELESSRVGLSVAAISPTASLAHRTLRGLHFREKYGLTALAIWRQGRILRSDLANQILQFGDAFLLHGPRDKLRLLAAEPDFLVLTQDVQEAPHYEKAPWAIILMAGVLVATLSGWLPIYIAAVVGATLMILTGCLGIEDAYREIEWRAVFLIGGMLPLGIAMQKTGAALWVAGRVVELVGDFGPLALVAGLFLLSVFGAMVMPTAATALLLAPIAIDTAAGVGMSPLSLVMAVAVGSSSSFISPVTHPANVLVMGPGGYRFVDYVKIGVGLTLTVLLTVLLVLPLVWPYDG